MNQITTELARIAGVPASRIRIVQVLTSQISVSGVSHAGLFFPFFAFRCCSFFLLSLFL
jgi:hypothetical protein